MPHAHASGFPSPGLSRAERSRGTGPRATVKGTASLTVGRGPVPRHAPVYRTIAGETRSDARMASEGPRATETSRPEGSPTEHIEI